MRKLFPLLFMLLFSMTVMAQDTVNLCPDDKHPHAIDMGLPSGTKWACCNTGASSPEGYGGYPSPATVGTSTSWASGSSVAIGHRRSVSMAKAVLAPSTSIPTGGNWATASATMLSLCAPSAHKRPTFYYVLTFFSHIFAAQYNHIKL